MTPESVPKWWNVPSLYFIQTEVLADIHSLYEIVGLFKNIYFFSISLVFWFRLFLLFSFSVILRSTTLWLMMPRKCSYNFQPLPISSHFNVWVFDMFSSGSFSPAFSTKYFPQSSYSTQEQPWPFLDWFSRRGFWSWYLISIWSSTWIFSSVTAGVEDRYQV